MDRMTEIKQGDNSSHVQFFKNVQLFIMSSL